MSNSNVISGLVMFLFSIVCIYIICSFTISSMLSLGTFEIVDGFTDYMKQEFIDCFDLIENNLNQDIDEIDVLFETEFNNIKHNMENTYSNVINDADKLIKSFDTDIVNFIISDKTQVESCVNYLEYLINESSKDMIKYVSSATNIMLDDTEKTCKYIVNTVDNEFNYFISYVDSEIDSALMSLYNTMVDCADILGATIELFCKEAQDGLIYAGSDLIKYGQKAWDSIENGTENVINTVVNTVKNVTKTVTKTVSKWF